MNKTFLKFVLVGVGLLAITAGVILFVKNLDSSDQVSTAGELITSDKNQSSEEIVTVFDNGSESSGTNVGSVSGAEDNSKSEEIEVSGTDTAVQPSEKSSAKSNVEVTELPQTGLKQSVSYLGAISLTLSGLYFFKSRKVAL